MNKAVLITVIFLINSSNAMNVQSLELIRNKLDYYSFQIITRLYSRAWYLTCNPIYSPGGTNRIERKDISYFNHTLEHKEKFYSSLGRYKFEDQTALTTGIQQETTNFSEQFKATNMQIGNDILEYYLNTIIPHVCLDGDQPEFYGEIVDLDTSILIYINARINQGLNVAQAKLEKDNSLVKKINNTEDLMNALTYKDREKSVIETATNMALGICDTATVLSKRIDRDRFANTVKSLFELMIQKTKELQVSYIIMKASCSEQKL